MKLYTFARSGHAHRAHLFLSLVGAKFEAIEMDLAGGAHKRPEFLAMNRFGQVPVLDDDGVVVPDSNAIMVYVARKLGRTDWLPEDPGGVSAVQRWLSVAAGQIAYGPCAARLITVFGRKFDADEVIGRSHDILKIINEELAARAWIAADRATIADIALYTYIAHAPEGNVDLTPYANVRGWLARVEALPNFLPMPKTAAGLVT